MDLTVKQYAESKGVTPQVIYKYLKKYDKELKKFTYKEGGVLRLKEYAMDFLNQYIRDNAIVVIDRTKDEEIKRLLEENNKLKDKLLENADQSQEYILMIAELRTKLALLESKQEEPKKRWWQRK